MNMTVHATRSHCSARSPNRPLSERTTATTLAPVYVSECMYVSMHVYDMRNNERQFNVNRS